MERLLLSVSIRRLHQYYVYTGVCLWGHFYIMPSKILTPICRPTCILPYLIHSGAKPLTVLRLDRDRIAEPYNKVLWALAYNIYCICSIGLCMYVCIGWWWRNKHYYQVIMASTNDLLTFSLAADRTGLCYLGWCTHTIYSILGWSTLL